MEGRSDDVCFKHVELETSVVNTERNPLQTNENMGAEFKAGILDHRVITILLIQFEILLQSRHRYVAQ